MQLLKLVPLVGVFGAGAYYFLCLYGIRHFRRQLQKRARSGFTPAVSLLKPLCGADPQAYESLRSHCMQDYPNFEIIFGVSDPNDVAIEVVQRLIREFPARRIELVLCSGVLGSNLKVSNLIQMLPHARHEYVLVNDSDIYVEPKYLETVMGEFENERVGLVTCLYRGLAGHTLGSKLEALGINTDFIPGVLSARHVEKGIRFGLGSTLAIRRKALEIIGGFTTVADYLGDDYELGKRISDAGFSVELASTVVDHFLPDYAFVDYWRHQLRWARTVRDSRPEGFAGLIFTFGLFWAVLLVIGNPSAIWSWSILAIIAILRVTVAIKAAGILNRGRLWRETWLLPLRDVLNVAIWAYSYSGRRIVWRGNQFTLENGKLRP